MPESWEWVRIKDIFFINPKNDLDDNIDVSFIPMQLISDEFTNGHKSEIRKWKDVKRGFTHFREGDVAVAKITPCFENRKSVILNNLENHFGAGTTELHILRPILEPLLVNYTLCLIKSEYFINHGVSHFSGAVGQQRVGRNILEETWFPLPPLLEQNRIVAEVERLFELINIIEESKISLEQIIKQTKSKILDLAIRGKLVTQDSEEESASMLLKKIRKDDKIKKGSSDKSHYPFEVPSSWVWCGLHEIADVSLGKTLDRQRNTGTYKTYLRSVNVRWGFIDLDDVKEMRFEESEEDRYSLQFGDLLICEGGEAGRAAIWKYKNKSMRYQNALHRARFRFGIKADFYLYALRHYQNTKILDNYIKGVTIKHLTGQALRQMSFPLPPIKEQQRIVEKIEEIYMLLDQIKDNLQTDS